MTDVYMSIASFIMKQVGYNADATAYFESIKGAMDKPAIYFPVPEENIEKVTLGYTHTEDGMLFVQIFHKTTSEAIKLAKQVKIAVLSNKSFIPILNYDGTETGDRVKVHIKKIQKIDEGVAQVTLNWTCHTNYVPTEEKNVTNIIVGIATEGEKNG